MGQEKKACGLGEKTNGLGEEVNGLGVNHCSEYDSAVLCNQVFSAT